MSQFPRIWDRIAEREIVGETAVSWLVKSTTEWARALPEKVNKRDPNKSKGKAYIVRKNWFFSEKERDLEVWADHHFISIQNALGRHSRNIDAATLKKIADLIGYKEFDK